MQGRVETIHHATISVVLGNRQNCTKTEVDVVQCTIFVSVEGVTEGLVGVLTKVDPTFRTSNCAIGPVRHSVATETKDTKQQR
jgi:hypothetical protein